ncbi:hypothetical protein CO151_00685 [bacterium CG_4_9_14_3_um_filter_65_15]|nr:MAG: hypothetical protein CO151_00685 [bacterium CG_4_9_14_3_um_filter_65_15]
MMILYWTSGVRLQLEGYIMKRIWSPQLFVGALLFLAFAVPVSAQVYTVDYFGYGWEQAPGPVKAAGDELIITCTADNIDPAFGVDLGTEEVTLHIHGLISAGPVDMGGYLVVNYTGGFMEIYQDPGMNADWGVNPPNAVSPGTFSDGALFFAGQFTSFTMYFDSSGSTGSFSGNLDGLGGSILGSMCTNCVYTWGGVFTTAGSAQIPLGYDFQIDGVFEIDSAVDTETTSWGSLKSLFK